MYVQYFFLVYKYIDTAVKYKIGIQRITHWHDYVRWLSDITVAIYIRQIIGDHIKNK